MRVKAIKLLFKRNRYQGIRLAIYASLALGLMIAEHNGSLSAVRSGLTLVVAPFQYLVNWPIDSLHWLETSMVSMHELRMENAALRSDQLLLQAKLQKLMALENENAQLKSLLQSSLYVRGKSQVAQLLEVSLSPFAQQVILNKGSRDQVFVGQPVLDAHGVMGQVIEVGPATSRVLLITDSQSAVPIQNNRNGVRAVAKGCGYCGELQLMYVPDTVDFHVGDRLMTSGLGKRYPAGYPVGVISHVEHLSAERFAKIRIKPQAHLNRSNQVLLVWPEHAPPSNPAMATKTVTQIHTFGASPS